MRSATPCATGRARSGSRPTTRPSGTGYLRHLVVREGRNTGQALVQLVTAPGERFERDALRRRAAPLPGGALDPLGDQRHARRGHEPADRAPLGRRGDRGGDLRPPLPRAAERVPADEHRHGRAALRARARVRGADRRRDGLRPLLRHRHDRPLDRARRADGLGCRGLGGVGRVRARERRPERRSRTRRSSPARSGQSLEELADRAGEPDVVVVDPPRAGLAGKALRRVGRLSPRRGSSTSRATRRRSPAT